MPRPNVRVWAAAHRRTKLTPANLTAEVAFMLKRSRRGAATAR